MADLLASSDFWQLFVFQKIQLSQMNFTP